MSEQKTEQKHTPGPWEFWPAISSSPHMVFLGRRIGCIHVHHSGYVDQDGSIAAEQEANARLIAAAPELLEALKWLVDLMPDPELDSDPVQREQVIKARAAIAKATGEQP